MAYSWPFHLSIIVSCGQCSVTGGPCRVCTMHNIKARLHGCAEGPAKLWLVGQSWPCTQKMQLARPLAQLLVDSCSPKITKYIKHLLAHTKSRVVAHLGTQVPSSASCGDYESCVGKIKIIFFDRPSTSGKESASVLFSPPSWSTRSLTMPSGNF